MTLLKRIRSRSNRVEHVKPGPYGLKVAPYVEVTQDGDCWEARIWWSGKEKGFRDAFEVDCSSRENLWKKVDSRMRIEAGYRPSPEFSGPLTEEMLCQPLPPRPRKE